MDNISVVIPLFNKAAYIGRTITSILSQTILPDEIIVVDDGSTDGGGEVVKTFNDSRIRLIRQENRGVGAARNHGAQEAKGEVIAFCDADDAWKPHFLEVIQHLRGRFPQAGAYATAYERITPSGLRYQPEFAVLPPGVPEGLIPNYFKAAASLPVCSTAVAVPKRILEEVGGFPVGEILYEDIDTWLRIALRYPIAWSRQYAATYFQNAANRAINVKIVAQEPVISRTVRQAIHSGQVPADSINDLKEYAASFQLQATSHCLMVGNKERALQLLEYARGTQRFARRWWKLRIMAALPGNPALWLWKVRVSLKNLFPGLVLWKNRRSLKGLLQ